MCIRDRCLGFGGLVDRSLEPELKMGDTIYRPSISNLGSASSKSANTAITYTTVTETHSGGGGGGGGLDGTNMNGVTVTITNDKYIAIAIESIAKVQTDRDLMSKYAGKMGYTLAVDFDNALSTLVDDFSQEVGTLASNLTYSNVTRAIQYLDDVDAPAEDRCFVFSPAQAINIMSHDEFVNNDYSKLQGSWSDHPGMGRAYQTSWWGTPIYRSTNVEGTNAAGHDNVYFHKMALTAIMQLSPKTTHDYDIDYLVDKVAMEQIYGVLEQWDDHGVWCKGD